MPDFFEDNEDLKFYFDRAIDWAPLVKITEFGYRTPDGFKKPEDAVAFYRDVAKMVGAFAANEIAPYAKQLDREGVEWRDGEAHFPPRLAGIFDKIKELGLHGLTVPRELGGMNAPLLVYFLTAELLARGDVSVMAHHSFHGGMAMAMLFFSILEGTTEVDKAQFKIAHTRFQKEIEEIVRGEAWGSMDITEPDAGSDMAALRAHAEQDASGQWFVTGEKIFITSGHGKYHFVIARTEKPGSPDDPFAGLGGLSMFLVPTYEIDAQGNKKWLSSFDRIEHKLGHHGSVTAAQTFDRTPAQLIGKRGEGFKYMLVLMNNARLGVGFESIGLCEAAYRLSKEYAENRPSMGKTIDKHEMVADYLDEMRTDIQGLRAMAVEAAIQEELAQKLKLALTFEAPEDALEKKRLERRIKDHSRRARRLTPLLKYLAAEKAVEMSRRAIQLHGGNGYITEYGAEKLLRDALVMPIYEGTSQIQSLMAMKDTLTQILSDPGAFVRRIAEARLRALSARDPLERAVGRVQQASLSAQQHLITRTTTDKVRSLKSVPVASWPDAFLKNWNPKRDFAYAMLHAERLTRLLADEAICELLLAQAKAHPERREVLERYLERAEPRCRYLAEQIAHGGNRLLASLRNGDDAADQRQSA